MIPTGHAARINLIGISILRYLILKNEPIDSTKIHLEWCFCNRHDNWDLTEKDFRAVIRSLKNNQLCDEFSQKGEKFYKISPSGIQLLKQFIEIDTNITQENWK